MEFAVNQPEFGKSSSNDENIKSNNTAKNRLQRELMDLMTSLDKGISAFPHDDNIFGQVYFIYY